MHGLKPRKITTNGTPPLRLSSAHTHRPFALYTLRHLSPTVTSANPRRPPLLALPCRSCTARLRLSAVCTIPYRRGIAASPGEAGLQTAFVGPAFLSLDQITLYALRTAAHTHTSRQGNASHQTPQVPYLRRVRPLSLLQSLAVDKPKRGGALSTISGSHPKTAFGVTLPHVYKEDKLPNLEARLRLLRLTSIPTRKASLDLLPHPPGEANFGSVAGTSRAHIFSLIYILTNPTSCLGPTLATVLATANRNRTLPRATIRRFPVAVKRATDPKGSGH